MKKIRLLMVAAVMVCVALFGALSTHAYFSYWETGEYEEIMTVDDYIYYYGPYVNDDGSHDGVLTIRTYYKKTGEEKQLVYRGYKLQRIGNKMFMLSGFSSGSWSRNLYCCDLDGENVKMITNGAEMRLMDEGENLTVFNNRIYVGHCPDMEHFEVISCNLDGEDIRVEVPSVDSTAWQCELHESYAIIDGETYMYQYTKPVTIEINGLVIEFDQQPVIIDGRTLVPLRAIFEALGASVDWNGNTKTVTARKNDTEIKLTVGENVFYKNGEEIALDVPAMIISDRTLVPVRAISEAFDCDVQWDGNTKTVSITADVGRNVNKILVDFVENEFEQANMTIQADNYTDMKNDDTYLTFKQTLTDYALIDLDEDGENELVITALPVYDINKYYGYCMSIWECDENNKVKCVFSKGGNTSRGAFSYHIARCYGQLCLYEMCKLGSSGGNYSVRNAYQYTNGEFVKIHGVHYDSYMYRGEEVYTLNDEPVSPETALKGIDDIEENTEKIFSQVR